MNKLNTTALALIMNLCLSTFAQSAERDLNISPTAENPMCASNKNELEKNWVLKALSFGESVFERNYKRTDAKANSMIGEGALKGQNFIFKDLIMSIVPDGTVIVRGITKRGGSVELDRGKIQICHDGKNLYTVATTSLSGEVKTILTDRSSGNVVKAKDLFDVEQTFTKTDEKIQDTEAAQ